MKQIKFIFLLLAVLQTLNLRAQVTVEAKLDSMRIYVGEQTGISLTVTCDADQHLMMPQPTSFQRDADGISYLAPRVEIVHFEEPDTEYLNDGKRLQVSQKYIITSFDSTDYYLPPFDVLVDTTHYESNRTLLKVYSMEVDTLHLDVFFPQKDIVEAPFSWQDWKFVIYMSILVVVLVMLSILGFVWLRHGNPIIRLVRRKPKLPPHQVAMSRIEQIKGDHIAAKEDSKEYYTALTDTLRTYMKDRFGFNATEMTSSEIIDYLRENADVESLRELQQLFETADLVKFAKYNTMLNEKDANLLTAIQFVNETKLEVDPNAKDEEPAYTVEQKRSIGLKWALRVAIFLLTATSIYLTVKIVLRVIDLVE